MWLCGVALALGACGSPRQPPTVSAPANFVGSETCRSCHESQYANWEDSHHAHAMGVASGNTVLGDFNDTRFEYFDEAYRFFQRDGNYFVAAPDRNGQSQEFRLSYTFGVTPLQQYLVEFPDGRLQALPVAWDSRPAEDGGQHWFHLYADEYIAYDDPLHWTGREFTWNVMCAECHSTNVAVNYDEATDTFETSWSEINVACEGCHGPGSSHLAQARQGDFTGSFGLEVDLDDRGNATWQMNPRSGIAQRSEIRTRPQQQPEACGRCHARRGVLGRDYVYGQVLLQTHVPSLLSVPLYFPDGQIREEVYVYGSFLQSPMYQAGVSCSDCHEPHSLQLRTGPDPNAVCAQCHLPDRFAVTEHHRHDDGEAACVDCHMTSRTYMGVDVRRDHSFRVPRPDLSDMTGVPNACNNCHDDRNPQWAADIARQWWGENRFGQAHFAAAFHAVASRPSNDALLSTIADDRTPNIARATALSLIRAPLEQSDVFAVADGLEDPDPLVRVGSLQAMRGWPPEWTLQLAIASLEDPIRAVRVEAVTVLADAYSQLSTAGMQAFTAAAEEYVEAQVAMLSRPEANANLGMLAAAMGKLDEAVGHYDRALAFEPDFDLARVNLAEVLRQAGDETKGESVLRAGLERHPESPVLRHALGLLLVRAGRRDEALLELRRAYALQPDDPNYAYVLGVALVSIGDRDEAVSFAEDLAARFPDDPRFAALLSTARQ